MRSFTDIVMWYPLFGIPAGIGFAAVWVSAGVQRIDLQLGDRLLLVVPWLVLCASSVLFPLGKTLASEPTAFDLIAADFVRDIEPGEVNRLLRAAAAGCYRGLIPYSDEAHASIDFNHDPHSAIIDGSQTRTAGTHLVNLFIWFDNEWGFANRMLEVADHWSKLWPAQQN